MTSPDPQRPWFSGFCLQGELAGQYELDLGKSSSGADGVCSGQANGNARQLLELDGLGPITIFVGANNSGKSRLMRGLFGNSGLVTHLRLRADSAESGPGLSSLQALAQEFLDWEDMMKDSFSLYFQNIEENLLACDWHWVRLLDLLDNIRSGMEKFIATLEEKLRNPVQSFWQEDDRVDQERKASRQYDIAKNWRDRYESLRQHSQLCGRISEFFSLRRCYVPMLRGMRPPSSPDFKNQQGKVSLD